MCHIRPHYNSGTSLKTVSKYSHILIHWGEARVSTHEVWDEAIQPITISILCICICIHLCKCIYMQAYVSIQPEMLIVNIPLNSVRWQREDTHSKSNFPSLISVWPVSKLIRNRLSTANCYLISRLLRPIAPLMPGRARMSGETMGLLVACQRWKALWTTRRRLVLWESPGLGSLIL